MSKHTTDILDLLQTAYLETQDVRRLWGEEATLHHAIGECGELTALLGRKAMGRDSPEEWVEELVDVLLSMMSTSRIFHEEFFKRTLARERGLL